MSNARHVLPAKARKALAEETRRALLTALVRAAVGSALAEMLEKREGRPIAPPPSPPCRLGSWFGAG